MTITQADHHKLIDYDPHTGIAVWFPREGDFDFDRRRAGRRVGYIETPCCFQHYSVANF